MSSGLMFLSLISFNPRVLAGGRDIGRQRRAFNAEVSIHASSREDATSDWRGWQRDGRFNPRVLAGGRDVRDPLHLWCDAVSIHASSREDATKS